MTFFKPPYNTKDEDFAPATTLNQPGRDHFIFALSFFIIALTLAMPNLTPVEAKAAVKTVYTLQCSDSDGSKTITQGTTKLSQLNTKTKKVTQVDLKTDQCASATKVREYFCAFDKKTQTNQLQFIDVSCGGGQYCSKGACIPLPPLAPAEKSAPVAPVTITPVPAPVAIPVVTAKTLPGVFITGEYPRVNDVFTQTISSGSHIARFKITNAGNTAITITSLDITDNGTHWGTSTTLKLYFSDENSTNFTANVAATGSDDTSFLSLANGGFVVNGGSYRFVTVAIDRVGNMLSGDFFNLSIDSLGDVKYSVNESDLGYDANGNSTIAETISNLPVDGRPTLGTLIKL